NSSLFTLYRLSLGTDGIQTAGAGIPGLAYGFNQTPQYYNGRLYFNSFGLVIDPVQRLQIATLPYVAVPSGDFTIDADAGVIYFSRGDGYERYFWAFDANLFTPLASVDVYHAPNNQWIQKSMVRCG